MLLNALIVQSNIWPFKICILLRAISPLRQSYPIRFFRFRRISPVSNTLLHTYPYPICPVQPVQPVQIVVGQSALLECWLALQQFGIQRGNDRQPLDRQIGNLIDPDRLALATVGEPPLAAQKQRSSLHEGTTATPSLDSLSRPPPVLSGILVAQRRTTTGLLFDRLGHDGSSRGWERSMFKSLTA